MCASSSLGLLRLDEPCQKLQNLRHYKNEEGRGGKTLGMDETLERAGPLVRDLKANAEEAYTWFRDYYKM